MGGPSDDDPGCARLIIEATQQEISFFDEITIGRSEGNGLRLDDRSVSRRHAFVRREPNGSYWIGDLGSANGTVVDKKTVFAAIELRDGAEIRVGDSGLVFRKPPSSDDADLASDDLDADLATSQDKTTRARVLIARSPAMVEVVQLIAKAAKVDIPVLIEGETGTGKELVARGVHESSRRAGGPFIAVNCAAMPGELLESQLFGHVRGAFTGAIVHQEGIFEAASGGTLFLDEIGEMSLSLQAKLLRVLQEGAVTRIGETRPRRVDVRIVSATNRELVREVDEERYRADLYFRLSGFGIALPPLRARREDIPVLADVFVAKFARAAGKRVRGVSREALAALERFLWPGNVRELENEMHRAVALAPSGSSIQLEHLSSKLVESSPPRTKESERPSLDATASETLAERRRAFETQYIDEVLKREKQLTKAARVLGITRAGLHKKLKELGLR